MSTRAFNDFPSVKYDGNGKMTVMARSGGYVMARRPHAIPFVKTEKEWLALPDAQIEARNKAQGE